MTLEIEVRKLDDFVSRRAAARLRSFRRDAERILPGRIAQVVLFGSRARGDARRDSDYDVAVFVRDLKEPRPVDHALAHAAYRHMLVGYHINAVAVPADFLNAASPSTLRYHIARDGVPVS